jgi:hypothetical protein
LFYVVETKQWKLFLVGLFVICTHG